MKRIIYIAIIIVYLLSNGNAESQLVDKTPAAIPVAPTVYDREPVTFTWCCSAS